MSDTATSLVVYFLILATLISPIFVAVKRYGGQGLLWATLGLVAAILGGGTLFWVWFADQQRRINSDWHTVELDEAVAFAIIWQFIPLLTALFAATACLPVIGKRRKS